LSETWSILLKLFPDFCHYQLVIKFQVLICFVCTPAPPLSLKALRTGIFLFSQLPT
jgi:hypothetical protein